MSPLVAGRLFRLQTLGQRGLERVPPAPCEKGFTAKDLDARPRHKVSCAPAFDRTFSYIKLTFPRTAKELAFRYFQVAFPLCPALFRWLIIYER